MAAKGPEIHIDYGYAYPVQVDRADSRLPVFTARTLVFRVGVPGPVDGTVAAPIVELELTTVDDDTAIGTVPAGDTEALEPDTAYEYHVEIEETGYLIAHGRCRVERRAGHS